MRPAGTAPAMVQAAMVGGGMKLGHQLVVTGLMELVTSTNIWNLRCSLSRRRLKRSLSHRNLTYMNGEALMQRLGSGCAASDLPQILIDPAVGALNGPAAGQTQRTENESERELWLE